MKIIRHAQPDTLSRSHGQIKWGERYMTNYKRDDYIQEIKDGQRCFGEYLYRVMDRQFSRTTHHTNSLEDAQRWTEKCIKFWHKQDELSA